jgi:hypothetical protein
MVSSITAVVVVVPASGEAIMGLPETIAKEGECRCSVCLEAANDKLRMMPCSHSFHEQCIFNWLVINHVCHFAASHCPRSSSARKMMIGKLCAKKPEHRNLADMCIWLKLQFKHGHNFTGQHTVKGTMLVKLDMYFLCCIIALNIDRKMVTCQLAKNH